MTRFLASNPEGHPFAAPDSLQQTGLDITSYVTLLVAIIALVSSVITKKAKSPADELAKADFAYTQIKERLEEVNKDRAYLQSVVDALRLRARQTDKDATADMLEKQTLRELAEQGEDRIRKLERENTMLNQRLERIAEKVKNDEPITLGDVYGNVTPLASAHGIDPETEETQTPQAVRRMMNPDREEA